MFDSTVMDAALISAAGTAAGSMPDLVPPHPLDFDWRFTASTAEILWTIVSRLVNPSDDIALLGTPTLTAFVPTRSRPRRVVLFDKNAHHRVGVPDGVEFTECDILRDPIPAIEAGLVMADPPWYERETLSFL